jgi:hypothetical protein
MFPLHRQGSDAIKVNIGDSMAMRAVVTAGDRIRPEYFA